MVQWISSKGMNTATLVKTLDEAVSISHGANAVEKRMNPTILPPGMGKIIGQTGLFCLGMATSPRE